MNRTNPTITQPKLKRYQWPALTVGLIGLIVSVIGAFFNLDQFWQSYLLAYIFWLQFGLGCLAMVMLHHLVGGRWSFVIRRSMETGAMTLPLMALLFIPLLAGLTSLYSWTDPELLAQSDLLQHKSAYLNIPFFLIRAALYLIIWVGLAYLLNRWSMQQDRSGDPGLTTRMRRLSGLGMILYMVTATFAAYDWMMSLEPEWFSSIYGLLFITGHALAALALAIISLRSLSKQPSAAEIMPGSDWGASQILGNRDKPGGIRGGSPRAPLRLPKFWDAPSDWVNYFNDLGNFVLGFVMIWAYISFSQFLIIWSANLPEEAVWYYHRSRGGWQWVGVFLIAFHFVLPFLLLLSRLVKRKAQLLTLVAILIILVRWVDLYWLIVPAFYPNQIHAHWLDLALIITIGGGWIAVFLRQMATKPLLPLYDPHFQEVAKHEQSEEIVSP